jgi:hypothetical protein
MKKVPVEMNNVERVSGARHTIEKNQMVGERISVLRIEAQRAVARGFKYRIGPRVATGKQGYLVPLTNQLFREIRYYSLRAPIKLWWAALKQG